MNTRDILKANLDRVRIRIAAAAARSGRSAESVQLVAVTKTRPMEQIQALISTGQVVLGENRVQEAMPKISGISGVQWHLIGHLQTNKARFIPGTFDLVHSADSLKLLAALNEAAAKQQTRIHALLQVNMSHEEQKSGCEADEAFGLFEQADALPWVQLDGLMTMAAIVEDPEAVRPVFARLRDLQQKLLSAGIPKERLRHLSMGMSSDFEVAIEEGATLVRVGSALFEGL